MKIHQKNLILVIILLIGFVSGCQLNPQSILGKETDKFPVFMDDFSDHDNGWKVLVSPLGIVHYDGDSLRILVNEPNSDYWTTPGLALDDAILDVDASYVSGPSNNLFGLICRMKDAKNYYSFLISSDGYYGISKVENGMRTLLGASAMQTTKLVAPGETTNHIRVDCVGNNLSLFINWNQVLTVIDETYQSGDAGIIAATMEEPGTDIRFDNFIVIVP